MSPRNNINNLSRDEQERYSNSHNRYDDNDYGRRGTPEFPVATRHGSRRNRDGADRSGRGKHIHELDWNTHRNNPFGYKADPEIHAPYSGSGIYKHTQSYTDHSDEEYIYTHGHDNDWANEDYYYNPYDPEGSQEGYFGTEGRVSQHTLNPYGQYGYDTYRQDWDDEDIENNRERSISKVRGPSLTENKSRNYRDNYNTASRVTARKKGSNRVTAWRSRR